MNNKEVVKILNNEAECVRRQDTPLCARCIMNNPQACKVCDLAMPADKILEAYATATAALEGAAEAYKAGYIKAGLEGICQPRAYWKPLNGRPELCRCSKCGFILLKARAETFVYCPKCGARHGVN